MNTVQIKAKERLSSEHNNEAVLRGSDEVT